MGGRALVEVKVVFVGPAAEGRREPQEASPMRRMRMLGAKGGGRPDFLAKFDQSAEGLRKCVALATLSDPAGLAITLLGHMAAA